MKPRNFLIGCAFMLFGMSASHAAPTPETLEGVKTVTAEEVTQMQAKGVPIVDTRVATEYSEKTIKGAISIPFHEKSAKEIAFDRSKDSFDLTKLPQDKSAPVVFFCNGPECWKSYKASVVARDAGYKNIHRFRGGMPEWTSKNLPTQ